MSKVNQYGLEIKNGFPPKHKKTMYDDKLFEGELRRVADQIEPGQYVEISAGSQGKFKGFVESRGLKVVSNRGQGEPVAKVYVVTPEWLSDNPDVLP
jgi:hypothetical protein